MKVKEMSDRKKLIKTVVECIEAKNNKGEKLSVGVTMDEISAAIKTLSSIRPSHTELNDYLKKLTKREDK